MFKWFAMGTSEEPDDPMFFIVPNEFDTARALTGGYTEEELGNAVIAQAQTEAWAAKITASLNVSVALNGGRPL